MNLPNNQLDAGNLDDFFQELLRIIGGVLYVSRSYIFEYCEKTDTMSNTYEWVRPGIMPQKETLQNIPMQVNPFWQECMLNNKPIVFDDIRHIPSFPENQILMEQGIESILVIPIYIAGKYYGFLGVDECANKRTWSELEIDLMQVMVVLIGTMAEKINSN